MKNGFCSVCKDEIDCSKPLVIDFVCMRMIQASRHDVVAQILPESSLQKGEVIGGGGEADAVYRAKYYDKPVAIKVVRTAGATKQDEASITSVLSITMLASHVSPHICKLEGVCWRETEAWIVMELCMKSLKQLVADAFAGRERPGLPIADVVAIGLVLCEALRAVHNCAGALHLDIKPENVLLANDNTIRLIDFGIAQRLRTQQSSATIRATAAGTIGWAPPEQMLRNNATKKSDIYSLGALLMFAASGREPFGKATSDQVRDKLRGGERIPVPKILKPGELKDLLFVMTSLDRDSRPGLVEVEQRLDKLRKELPAPEFVKPFWRDFPDTKVRSSPEKHFSL